MSTASACAANASPQMDDLCGGSPVQQELTLVLDTVRAVPATPLQALAGQRFHMTLRLLPLPGTARCRNATGTASFQADLPDEMTAGITQRASPTWRIMGISVVVDFNPGVADDNLRVVLPLNGGAGRWQLSRLTGLVAGGRVLTPSSRELDQHRSLLDSGARRDQYRFHHARPLRT
ncbi:MAG TPA: hypothetical protein VFW98_15445 [Gemmatimonadaceae bacterium]|nr:hypothetical protein [Gemmatimonadaceae bacterium]